MSSIIIPTTIKARVPRRNKIFSSILIYKIKMNFTEFMLNSLSVSVGIAIFVIIGYVVLKIFTGGDEGFEALELKDNGVFDDFEPLKED